MDTKIYKALAAIPPMLVSVDKDGNPLPDDQAIKGADQLIDIYPQGPVRDSMNKLLVFLITGVRPTLKAWKPVKGSEGLQRLVDASLTNATSVFARMCSMAVQASLLVKTEEEQKTLAELVAKAIQSFNDDVQVIGAGRNELSLLKQLAFVQSSEVTAATDADKAAIAQATGYRVSDTFKPEPFMDR